MADVTNIKILFKSNLEGQGFDTSGGAVQNKIRVVGTFTANDGDVLGLAKLGLQELDYISLRVLTDVSMVLEHVRYSPLTGAVRVLQSTGINVRVDSSSRNISFMAEGSSTAAPVLV